MTLQAMRSRGALIGHIVAVNVRGQAAHRADFLVGIADGVIYQTSVLVFASVILTRFPLVGDWSSRDVLLLAAMRMTSHSLTTLVFGRIVFIASLVQEGAIDTYLTRPMSVYQQIQLSRFSVNAFGDLAVGATLLTFAVSLSPHPWTVWRVALLGLGILGGALMEAAINTVLAGLTLLSPAAAPLVFRFEELLGTVGNYPLSILPWLAKGALTWVLPIAFIAYLPAAALTEHLVSTGLPPWLVYCSPLVAAASYQTARLIWNRCLDRYQGANG